MTRNPPRRSLYGKKLHQSWTEEEQAAIQLTYGVYMRKRDSHKEGTKYWHRWNDLMMMMDDAIYGQAEPQYFDAE